MKRRPNDYWLNPENIDKAFDELREELGRIPKYTEFGRRYSGALSAIRHGVYNPNIYHWDEYVEHRGHKPNVIRWTPEKIDKAFDKLREKLGRIPIRSDFEGFARGAEDAIDKGRYRSDIHGYNEYVIHRGHEPLYRTKAKIPKEELYRLRIVEKKTLKEIGKILRLRPEYVHKLLERENIEKGKKYKRKPQGYWLKPKNVDMAFDEYMDELGRMPTSTEFGKKYRGALVVLGNGVYSPEVHGYNDYVKHRGHKPKIIKWTPKKIDEAFDKLREEKGRVPRSKEFEKEYRGAIDAINKGRYDPEIRGYNEYVKHRGFECKQRIRTSQMEKPSREELYRLRIVERKTLKEIGDMFGVGYNAVSVWLIKEGLRDERIPKPPKERIPKPPKEKLFDEYVIKGKNSILMSNELEVSYSTVLNWLKEDNIPIRGLDFKRIKWKEIPTKERLEELYLEDFRSASEIAKLLGTCTSTIFNYLRKYEIETRDGSLTVLRGRKKPSKDVLTRLYWSEEKTIGEIAKEIGVSASTIRNWFKNDNIKTRGVKPKEKISKETLYEYYINRGLMAKEIAEKLDVTESIVRYQLRGYKIKKRVITKPPKELLYKYYVIDGKSLKDLAKELRVDNRTASAWLIEDGIELRDKSSCKLGSKKIPSKEEMYRLYVLEDKSMRKIAKEVGVNYATILRWVKKYKIIKPYNNKIRTEEDLVEFFKKDGTAKKIVEIFGGDDVDVADILTVVYEGRVKREDLLHLMLKPSIRDYLGNFQRPGSLGGIIDASEDVLKFDKDGFIERILKNRIIRYRMEKLGPNPTKEQRDEFLDELKRELEKYK